MDAWRKVLISVLSCVLLGCANVRPPEPQQSSEGEGIVSVKLEDHGGWIVPRASVQSVEVMKQPTSAPTHECEHLCGTRAFIYRHRYVIGAALASAAIYGLVRHSGNKSCDPVVVTKDNPENLVNPTYKTTECTK
jgi:hypothetical protein